MQHFPGNQELGLLNLEAHQLTLVTVKKSLDKDHFRTAQKIIQKEPPSLKLGNRVYFKSNKWGNGFLSGDPDTGLFILMGSTSTTLPTYQPSPKTIEDENLTHVNSHL